MVGLKQSIVNPVAKHLPKANNLIGSGVVGIGAYKIARFIDSLTGNRIQSFGIQLPFVGSLSLLDVIMLLAFKASMHKNSMVAAAFAGDRVFNLAISPANLIPGLRMEKNTSSPTASSGTQGGGF